MRGIIFDFLFSTSLLFPGAGVANGVEYSGYVAVPYSDSTQLPLNDTWHPKIPNVVYNGMDW